MYNNLNWYLFNDIEREKKLYSQKLITEAKSREKALCKDVNKNRDAIWCIMALCHDLGYSLAKLDNLNEKVKNVLKFFDIPDFRHLGYSLDIEHHYIVSQFLELMAMDVRIVPSADKKDFLIKCYRDDSTYWRLCVFISMPSASNGPWSGIAGVQKLIGAKVMKRLENEERKRVIESATKFLSPKGKVVAFQKNAWNGLISDGDPDYSVDLAREGKLKGRLNGMPHIPLFCVPPTRLSGPCSGILKQLTKS
ncbi:hypothetical protein ACFL0M_10190 [Thermodesulfobacteriota bacterium]